MDKATVLAKVPKEFHATAADLNAKGLDWSKVLAAVQMLMQLMPYIIDIFNKPTPPMAAGHHCPEHVKADLDAAVAAQLQSLASLTCARHCLCCPDE